MYFKSKKISLLILGIVSIVCSRTMFWFFDDPEGPNLLVVGVAAAIIYTLTLAIYVRNHREGSPLQLFSWLPRTGLKRLMVMICIQIVITSAFYVVLNVIPN